jgi:hypothetical protein
MGVATLIGAASGLADGVYGARFGTSQSLQYFQPFSPTNVTTSGPNQGTLSQPGLCRDALTPHDARVRPGVGWNSNDAS